MIISVMQDPNSSVSWRTFGVDPSAHEAIRNAMGSWPPRPPKRQQKDKKKRTRSETGGRARSRPGAQAGWGGGRSEVLSVTTAA